MEDETAELKAEDMMLAPEEAARHVTIWNRAENRKIAGNAAPLRRNLQKYLAKHPECEVYTEQDRMLMQPGAPGAMMQSADAAAAASLASAQQQQQFAQNGSGAQSGNVHVQGFNTQNQPGFAITVTEHVPIWHVEERRKITGNAAPLRKNLEAYLQRHPECEEYRGQDKAGAGPCDGSTQQYSAVSGNFGAAAHSRQTANSSVVEPASSTNSGGIQQQQQQPMDVAHPPGMIMCSCGQLVPQASLAQPQQSSNGIPIPQSGFISSSADGALGSGQNMFGLHVDAHQGFAVPGAADVHGVGGAGGALSSSLAMSLNTALATPNELAVYMGLGSAGMVLGETLLEQHHGADPVAQYQQAQQGCAQQQQQQQQQHHNGISNTSSIFQQAGGVSAASMSFSPSNFLVLGGSTGGATSHLAYHMQQQQQQQQHAQQQQHQQYQ